MGFSLTQPNPEKGLKIFFLGLALLFVLRFVTGLLVLPIWAAIWLGVINTIIFICTPIYAILHAASHPWKPSKALIFLLIGVALQVSMVVIGRGMPRTGLLPVLLSTVGQTGLLVWCLGLGALLASLIKDKNIIIPAAIFLAGFDVFLVTAPNTFVSQTVNNNQELFRNVAMSVPTATAAPTTPTAAPTAAGVVEFAFVGPADLLFAAFFLTLLFRFSLRTVETGKWLGPALVGYMAIVFLTRLPLPALVPIGIVILWFNWREFTLSKEERQMTVGVSVLAVALAVAGITLRLNHKEPARRAAPSPPATAPAPPAQGGLPGQSSPDRAPNPGPSSP